MRAFLICPVRGHDPVESKEFVSILEDQGIEVYWPPRDTKQDDPTGYTICLENLEGIKASDVVYVVWDGKSQGCLFDLGMAFALGKKVRPIMLPEASEGKSFQNMVREWSKHG